MLIPTIVALAVGTGARGRSQTAAARDCRRCPSSTTTNCCCCRKVLWLVLLHLRRQLLVNLAHCRGAEVLADARSAGHRRRRRGVVLTEPLLVSLLLLQRVGHHRSGQ